MWRTVLAVIGGLVAWMAAVTLINLGIREALPGYAAAEPTLDFTLPMMMARLAMAAVASIAAGAVIRSVAPASKAAPWIVGVAMLLFFLPVHVQIWARLPVWYHLFFLITLPPFFALGARLRGVPRTRPEYATTRG